MAPRMQALGNAGRRAGQLVRAQVEQAAGSHSTAGTTAGRTAGMMTAGADSQLLVRTGGSNASLGTSGTRILAPPGPRDQVSVHMSSLGASRARSGASLPPLAQQFGASLPFSAQQQLGGAGGGVCPAGGLKEVLGMAEAATSRDVMWKWREGLVGHRGRMWSQLCGDQAASKAFFTRQLATSAGPDLSAGGATGPVKVGSSSGAAGASAAPPPLPPPPPLPEKPARWSHVLRSILDLKQVPLVPLSLGLAGAIPFVALVPPLAPFLPLPELLASQALHAQVSYGHLILSFLGAPHWGLAMANFGVPPSARAAAFTTNSIRYVWSVVPCLLAWGASLLPQATQLAALIGSFWLVFGVDLMFARLKLTPPWYLALRLPLTVLATGGMALSLPVAAVRPTA